MGKALTTPVQHHQYLSFVLDDEEYGVNILLVQEIRGWESVKPIPNAPKFIAGVINLRGHVIPIVDMRKRFGLPDKPYTKTTVVIYVTVTNTEGQQVLGMIVDSVADVYDISDHDRRPCPDIVGAVDKQFLESMAIKGEKVIAIIDVNHMFEQQVLSDFISSTTRSNSNIGE